MTSSISRADDDRPPVRQVVLSFTEPEVMLILAALDDLAEWDMPPDTLAVYKAMEDRLSQEWLEVQALQYEPIPEGACRWCGLFEDGTTIREAFPTRNEPS